MATRKALDEMTFTQALRVWFLKGGVATVATQGRKVLRSLPLRCSLSHCGFRRVLFIALMFLVVPTCSWAVHIHVSYDKGTLTMDQPTAFGIVSLTGNYSHYLSGTGTKDKYIVSVPANKVAYVTVEMISLRHTASVSGLLVNIGNVHGDMSVNPTRTLKLEQTQSINVWVTALPFERLGRYVSDSMFLAFTSRSEYRITVEYADGYEIKYIGDILLGICEGIVAWIDFIVNVFAEMVNRILDFLGIHSPSKLFWSSFSLPLPFLLSFE